ncbi:DUF2294 domain-containing protein [Cohnella nanjingensis]|uniref:DUF2294 domain-containing protein n=1 Tax=Cohnella nanjingensis TaxID=1387779 RepID=A0A7X0RLR6_9BACL|nr:DUF2294 domain-containing protein [Cohnella nanjingensis]MBB6669797.1 DUF2294 domain-containing protein [Cohnella nanjingensis]
MPSKESAFNDIVRRVRKELFGKGPERIRTVFAENMAISTMHGNLTATEKFIARTPEGRDTVHATRTKRIQQIYAETVPAGMEELVGAKLLHLFSDIHLEEDMAVSVFVFDREIAGGRSSDD